MGLNGSNNITINTNAGHQISSQQVNQFSATTPNPHFMRVDTDNDLPSSANQNQLLTQSNKDHNLTNNTIIGSYATNKKTTKKTINASIWLSK